MPVYSRDGRSIYFASNRTGKSWQRDPRSQDHDPSRLWNVLEAHLRPGRVVKRRVGPARVVSQVQSQDSG